MRELLQGPFPRLTPRSLERVHLGEHHVFDSGQMGKEIELLKNHSHFAPVLGQSLGTGLDETATALHETNPMSGQVYRSLSGDFQEVDTSQKAALSGTAGADEGDY